MTHCTGHTRNGTCTQLESSYRHADPVPFTTLTTAEYARRVAITGAILGLAIVCWQVLDVLVLIFAGSILAIVLTSLAHFVERFTRLKGSWALAASTLGLIVLLAGIATLLGWRITNELSDLTEAVRDAWDKLRVILQHNALGRDLINGLTKDASGTTSPISGLTYAATGTVGIITACLIILFIGMFLAVDPPLYRRGLMSLVPRSRRERAGDLLEAIVVALRRWLGGVLLSMLCVGAITGIGLWLLGIPLALSLALLAGVLEFIPYAGPIVSAVPAILVGFTLNPTTAMEVAGLYLLVHLIEGYILVPLIQKRAVALPPALGITAVAVFGVLIGPLGVVLAHPLMVTLLVLIRKLYVEPASRTEQANAPLLSAKPRRQE